MSITRRDMEPHLARLRHHARAMTGSQSSGDAYVTAMLDILHDDATILPAVSCLRVALFRLYSLLAATSWGDGTGAGPADLWRPPAPDMLPQRIRQALLLISVERFSVGEVAEIMGITTQGVSTLIDAAGDSLTHLGGAEVMIIESEPLIAMNIVRIVEDLGLRVSSMPQTHAKALLILPRDRPDLIIADGGSHVGITDGLYTHIRPPVVFITAFSEMLLTGNRPEPVFIVRKPFEHAEMKALIFQALFFAQADKGYGPVLLGGPGTPAPWSRFSMRDDGRFIARPLSRQPTRQESRHGPVHP